MFLWWGFFLADPILAELGLIAPFVRVIILRDLLICRCGEEICDVMFAMRCDVDVGLCPVLSVVYEVYVVCERVVK